MSTRRREKPGYEPERATANVGQLIDAGVLALVGNVGTPTAVAAIPIANDAKTPFYGAFTGAGVLRKTPPDAGPSVLLATAHPAKFPAIVEEATGHPVPVPDTLASTLEAEERIVNMGPDLRVLRRMLIED